MDADEREAVVSFVSINPQAGEVMVGTGGARKFRGKSGGYRVVTFYAGADLPVLLLNVFTKGDRANLSKAEQNALQTRLAKLPDTYRGAAQMSKLDARMIRAADEALAYVSGEATSGFVVHKPVDVKALRTRLALAQPEFAKRYHLSVGTVRDWEQGRAVPDGPAQALLRVIDAEPEMVRRVLEHA